MAGGPVRGHLEVCCRPCGMVDIGLLMNMGLGNGHATQKSCRFEACPIQSWLRSLDSPLLMGSLSCDEGVKLPLKRARSLPLV